MTSGAGNVRQDLFFVRGVRTGASADHKRFGSQWGTVNLRRGGVTVFKPPFAYFGRGDPFPHRAHVSRIQSWIFFYDGFDRRKGFVERHARIETLQDDPVVVLLRVYVRSEMLVEGRLVWTDTLPIVEDRR